MKWRIWAKRPEKSPLGKIEGWCRSSHDKGTRIILFDNEEDAKQMAQKFNESVTTKDVTYKALEFKTTDGIERE